MQVVGLTNDYESDTDSSEEQEEEYDDETEEDEQEGEGEDEGEDDLFVATRSGRVAGSWRLSSYIGELFHNLLQYIYISDTKFTFI